ncbi:MAG: 3-deoxy-D-manno-octulosonic acid transferase [Nitrospirae bacterium]|nr:3-deoxy-D-manno-octulosonic acid transferase [Nitrospirota bacterium]
MKRPKELRRQWLLEKFGFVNALTTSHVSSCVWVHAVSVGEVMAVIALLKKIKEKYPRKVLLLTTITDTGQKIAKERSPEGTNILYMPFDIPVILRRFFRKIRPELLIILETELWPNLFRVSRQFRVPVILLNGRISEKSFRGYKKSSFFMKKILSNVDLFCMQTEVYAERIKSIGVDNGKIKILGNFKFDIKPPLKVPEWSDKIKGPVIIAGSTHDGEEELITSIFIRLKKDFPDLNLILAPRHPDRFKDVEALLKLKRLPFVKCSAFSGRLITSNVELLKGIIILLDSVGELSAVYGISDIAIIGKSFRGYGGQNPLEPAYWGKPLICGPHMENFPFIEDFYSKGAAIKVNEEGLYSALKELLLSPEKAKEIGLKAQQLYRKNTGAVDRAMEVLDDYIRE